MAKITVKDFDPNSPDQSVRMWLVYSGLLKLYSKRGPAIIHFLRRYTGSEAKLFEWDPLTLTWELLAHKDEYSKHEICDICGGPTTQLNAWGRAEERGKFVFDRRGRKLVEPLTLFFACEPCRVGRGLY